MALRDATDVVSGEPLTDAVVVVDGNALSDAEAVDKGVVPTDEEVLDNSVALREAMGVGEWVDAIVGNGLSEAV